MDLIYPAWVGGPGSRCGDRIRDFRWIWIRHDETRLSNDGALAIPLQPVALNIWRAARFGGIRTGHRGYRSVGKCPRARQSTSADNSACPNECANTHVFKLWKTSAGGLENLPVLWESTNVGLQLCEDAAPPIELITDNQIITQAAEEPMKMVSPQFVDYLVCHYLVKLDFSRCPDSEAKLDAQLYQVPVKSTACGEAEGDFYGAPS